MSQLWKSFFAGTRGGSCMKAVRAWFHRFIGLFHKRRSDAEFIAELESHLQLPLDSI